jgi:hypothetical protein
MLNESDHCVRSPNPPTNPGLQGVIGSIPWSAMVFYTLWLELVGYSHRMAAGLVAGFSVGSCLGGLFGGYMGDFLAKKSPDKGRGAGTLLHREIFTLGLCIINA